MNIDTGEQQDEQVIPQRIIEVAFEAGMRADPEPRSFVTAILRAGLNEIAKAQAAGIQITYPTPNEDSDALTEMVETIEATIFERLAIPATFLGELPRQLLRKLIRGTIEEAQALVRKTENES